MKGTQLIEKESEITVIATGDSMISKRFSVFEDEEFLSMIKIIREADVAFTNLEVCLHEWGIPYAKGSPGVVLGTPMAAEPFMAAELKWAGFNIVSFANNHTLDFGKEGMLTTMKNLDGVDLVHAGAGKNLSEAMEPAYLETKKGRIGLIAGCSWYKPWEMASEPRGKIPGRPGLNGLRYDTRYVITQEQFKRLEKIISDSKLLIPGESALRPELPEDEIEFPPRSGRIFKIGDKPGIYRRYKESEVDRYVRSIKDAKRSADIVLIGFHAHESDLRGIEYPADFLVRFARRCIDAGADAFIGHGPHILRGIEIYQKKPIFYSLGNFVAQNITVKHISSEHYESAGLDEKATPSDFQEARWGQLPFGEPPYNEWWWETVIASFVLKGGKMIELKLYPVTMGYGEPRSQAGRPVLANEIIGKKIIKNLNRISSMWDTSIDFKDGIGIVKL